ncbi:MAG: HAD-IB family phosphatase [Nitrososphaera sp.]|uniref:phosphoserine phosphatase n=1 Tax=Nitrososphaera gargensis (strain Ga9.2) TaxID=1237085 RepID=K0IE57_NITGG|nr:HAD-IB family phosphatase [Candidatus Nitrososphaera gargensis]AFU59641.1 phosphatase of the haloacid dehalogenase (HAD)-like hydrolase family [Candidatus Nitrososphaera gargensis Ga9.2]
MPKLAGFDMDGTLIQGRLVFALADRFDLSDKVRAIQQSEGMLGHEQTKAIAALFAGLTKKDLLDAIESIPLTKNCERTVAALRERGYYKIGIISDSYTVAASAVADRLQLDFVSANELQMENGKITGKVKMPLGWEKIGCFCKISVCKRYHLEKAARQFGVPIQATLAVGDTKSDICMIRRAGVGVVFMPKDSEIAKAADKIVQESDLLKVLEFAA